MQREIVCPKKLFHTVPESRPSFIFPFLHICLNSSTVDFLETFIVINHLNYITLARKHKKYCHPLPSNSRIHRRNAPPNNTNKSNKKELKTDYIKNPSINQREPEQYGEDIEQNNQRWIDRYNDAVEEIKENIEYDCFLSDRDKPLIDEIVKIMAEVLTMNTPYYTIEGKQYPAELVKQRFREVTNENLQSFLLEFNRHTEKIYNPKAYLITSLFNMPATADTVLTNMVKNDMAQGGF